MRDISEAQHQRQKARDRRGRYSTFHACELCGKSCGANYYSDRRCNETGLGVTLCRKCAARLDVLSDDGVRHALRPGEA